MIYHTVVTRIAPDQDEEAVEWSKQVIAYLKENYPGPAREMLRRIDGPSSEVVYFETFDSLGDYEAEEDKLDTDSEWKTLMAKGKGLFEPNSMEHHFYRSVL